MNKVAGKFIIRDGLKKIVVNKTEEKKLLNWLDELTSLLPCEYDKSYMPPSQNNEMFAHGNPLLIEDNMMNMANVDKALDSCVNCYMEV